MKIERISDNQIRCILTAGEMIKRHLSVKDGPETGLQDGSVLFHDL